MAVQSTTTGFSPSTRVEGKSSHVEDPVLQPFLQDKFDAAEYLNATLPSLTFSHASRETQSTRVPLAELTTQTQALMTHLNAQATRLTNTLNQVTDDILRSGSRLAYEVEILRGETVGLSDLLNEGLREDILHFVPHETEPVANTSTSTSPPEAADGLGGESMTTGAPGEPDYIAKLRTLSEVRSRLDSVIKVFGEAMQWPLAPSELSVASSIISVSGPSASGTDDTRDREEKGKEYAQKLRSEIAELLESAGSAEDGIAAAIKRIEELKDVSTVWKGTAEEKARARIIESLIKPVDEQQKALARKAEAKRRTASPSAVDYRYGHTSESARVVNQGGYGIFQKMQKLKDDIYLD